MNEDKQKLNKPKCPKRKTDLELDGIGFMAEEFQRNSEYEYLNGLLDGMIELRQWNKLNLSASQGEDLKRLCIEIDLLNEVKTSVIRDINVGKAARERETQKLGN